MIPLGGAIGLLLVLGLLMVVTRSGVATVALTAPVQTPTPLEEGPSSEGIDALVPDAVESMGEDSTAAEPTATGAAPTESSGVPSSAGTEDPATEVPEAPAPPAATETVEAGTCFDGSPRTVADILPVPCTSSHGAEIYVVLVAPAEEGTTYPGRDDLGERARQVCQGSAFEDFVGVPWAESRLFTSPIVPTEEAWNAGDRRIACFLYDVRGAMTGTARGSAQ